MVFVQMIVIDKVEVLGTFLVYLYFRWGFLDILLSLATCRLEIHVIAMNCLLCDSIGMLNWYSFMLEERSFSLP